MPKRKSLSDRGSAFEAGGDIVAMLLAAGETATPSHARLGARKRRRSMSPLDADSPTLLQSQAGAAEAPDREEIDEREA